MKIGTIILLILIAVVVVGGIVYFSIPKDKCANVTCLSGQECNSSTGKCESPSQNPMDRIEDAINDKLSSEDTSSLSGMDKIEKAINDKLSK